MTFLRWIIALPFIVGAVLFALSNSEAVLLTYSPFHDPIEFPLYFVSLTFLGVGFLLGAFMTWFGMGNVRKARRTLKKEVKALNKDSDKLKDKMEKLEIDLEKKNLEKAMSVIDVEHK